MKKYLFLAAAIVISLSIAGCSGSKDNAKNDAPQSTAVSDKADKTDKSDKTDSAGNNGGDSAQTVETGESKYDENFTDADKDVDMGAIEGEDASTAEDSESKGDINGSEIKIGDAKVTEFNGQKVIVVTYKFKNNAVENATFVGRINTEANQGEAALAPTTAYAAEGYVPETLVQVVSTGETITVQRAFTLIDEETPVQIMVESAVNPTIEERVTKTFEIK